MKESVQAAIQRLKAENAALRKQAEDRAMSGLSLKVSKPRKAGSYGEQDKGSTGGALSIYGVQRFPITLTKKGWRTILAKSSEIETFLVEHDKELTA